MHTLEVDKPFVVDHLYNRHFSCRFSLAFIMKREVRVMSVLFDYHAGIFSINFDSNTHIFVIKVSFRGAKGCPTDEEM